MNRFERQISLDGFGLESQNKLKNAKVLLIGAGGLGCPALLYLAAAGAGTIGVIDGDTVELTNLNRQVLYGINDVGKSKAKLAAEYILRKYDDVNCIALNEYLTKYNALDIISEYDVVVDGSDNFPTRYMVNDACLLLNKPLSLGSIYKNEGQICSLNINNNNVNYRDVYPELPPQEQVPNCNETGVLGVLPGIIGTMQAAEVIKMITGYGEAINGKILYYNLLSNSFYEVKIKSNGDNKRRINGKDEFLRADYSLICNSSIITWREVEFLINNKKNNMTLIDVRESDETPRISELCQFNIPLSQIEHDSERLKNIEIIALFCRSGIRSAKAAAILQTKYPFKTIYSIEGGLLHPLSPVNIK